MTEQERIDLALLCNDCDGIPKVSDAGLVTSGEHGEVQVMHNGIHLYCDSHYGAYNVEVIRGLCGHHEPQEEAVFHEVLKHIETGSVMLELGSFWAYYSLWFLNQIPQGRTILVEPVPSALEAGERNFSLNGAEGTFIHAAIGSVAKGLAPVELWTGFVVSAETITVDSLMRTQGIGHLGILHADIQGHEIQMLKGASETLRERRVDWIFISTHGENIHQRCCRILKKSGYFVAVEHTPSESFSVDGLIVASRFRGFRFQTSRRRTSSARIARAKSFVRVNLLEPLRLKPITD